MENKNILKPHTQNTAGKVLFSIFEIAALCVGALLFILGIIYAAKGAGFEAFIEYLVRAIFYLLVLYGLGKVIDLLSCKGDHHHKHEEKENNKED